MKIEQLPARLLEPRLPSRKFCNRINRVWLQLAETDVDRALPVITEGGYSFGEPLAVGYKGAG